MRNMILLSIVLLAITFVLPMLAMSGEPLYTPPGETAPTGAPSSLQPTPDETPAPTGDETMNGGNQEPPHALPPDKDIPVTVLVSGQVTEMNLRDYLFGVVAAEMPASFPLEAIKAQAAAARTFTYYTMDDGRTAAHEGADVCDSPGHCQAFLTREEARERWGEDADTYTQKLESALDETDGQVVLYDNRPILAVFHDSSSGKTERAADVWGEDYPYLQSVESPDETVAPRYFGEVEVSAATFWQIIQAAHPDAQPGGAVFAEYVYTDAGSVHSVKVGGVVCTGVELRSLFGLRSTHFTVAVRDGKVFFSTEGYGHGVGLSQYGSRALALEGKSFQEILSWYYKDTAIGKYDGIARQVFLEN